MISSNTNWESHYQTIVVGEQDFVETTSKIRGFLNYPENWCYGSGLKFTSSVIDLVVKLNTLAVESGYLTTDAFPGIEGDIKFTIYHENICLEFNVNLDLSIDYILEVGGEEEQNISLSIDDAENIITTFAEDLWSRGYYTPTGTTGQEGNSWTFHSNHRLIA